MVWFVDLRMDPIGGEPTDQPRLLWDGLPTNIAMFVEQVRERDVLFGIHGFNVDRKDGLARLTGWSGSLSLPENAVFIGVLWPGDGRYVPVLDYPLEDKIAHRCGRLLADFADDRLRFVSSLSFVSHSLGARVALEAIRCLGDHHVVRRAVLMAGAINADCLTNEYVKTIAAVGQVGVLASDSDSVLSMAFPIGNLAAGIVTEGHPWFSRALGLKGPTGVAPTNVRRTWQIPDLWDYGHGSYLPRGASANAAPCPVPYTKPFPPVSSPAPTGDKDFWQFRWSAKMVSEWFL